jgi:hypothetical protein
VLNAAFSSSAVRAVPKALAVVSVLASVLVGDAVILGSCQLAGNANPMKRVSRPNVGRELTEELVGFAFETSLSLLRVGKGTELSVRRSEHSNAARFRNPSHRGYSYTTVYLRYIGSGRWRDASLELRLLNFKFNFWRFFSPGNLQVKR